MSPAPVPTVRLTDSVSMPQLGFGVWQVPPDDAERAVADALDAGYRSIDTAAGYENEEGVGAALASSGIARDELFVTTKLANDDHGRDAARKAFDLSMDKLGLDVLDLYLIHWPVPGQDRYVETWKALEELQRDGRVRAIGVSNFTAAHLTRLFDEADVRPALNQVECHPYFSQTALRAFHDEHGIRTEAWSPIGQGQGLLDDPVLVRLGEQLGITPAQVVLRWHLQLGNVAIPKSVTPSRVRENLDVLGFTLSEEQVQQVSGLDRATRLGPDPDTFG